MVTFKVDLIALNLVLPCFVVISTGKSLHYLVSITVT